MSRIGKQPIQIPAGVTISIEPERVTVNGPKGELSERVHRDIKVSGARRMAPKASRSWSRAPPTAASTARSMA